MENFSSLFKIGWRQGSVLPQDLISVLIPLGRDLPTPNPDGLAIVLSQDCDINCQALEVEPFVDILWAVPASVVDGNLTLGKNPRKIQFQCMRAGREITLESSVRWKFELSRQELSKFRPESNVVLDEGVGTLLPKWVSKRFTRAAFPNVFNTRTFSSRKKIKKYLEQKGKKLSGIYLLLEEDELPPEQNYEIVIRGTMLDEDFDSPSFKGEVESAISKLASLLNEQSGIHVVDFGFVPEREFSISDLKVFKRWDYDALSYSDPDQSAFPVNE
jgi:hypothetical protein